MRIASNKITDVIRFFRGELNDVYGNEELETIISYCFVEFINIGKGEIILKQKETMRTINMHSISISNWRRNSHTNESAMAVNYYDDF